MSHPQFSTLCRVTTQCRLCLTPHLDLLALQTSRLPALEVVRLPPACLPRGAPEGQLAGHVGGGDPDYTSWNVLYC